MSLRPELGGGNLRLILGGGGDRTGEHNHEAIRNVDETFEASGSTVFNEGEVLGLIQQIARNEGISQGDLDVARIVRDKKGNVVSATRMVNQKRANGLGWGAIAFDYMAAGKGQSHSANQHVIARFYAPVEDPTTWCGGGEVAIFDGAKWQMKPGNIQEVVEISP